MTLDLLSFSDYGKNPKAFKSDFEKYLKMYDLNCSDRIIDAKNDCKAKESETITHFNNMLKKKENEIKALEDTVDSLQTKMADLQKTNSVETERLLYGKKYMTRQLKICTGEKAKLGEELKDLKKALEKSVVRNEGLFRQLADVLDRNRDSGQSTAAGFREEMENLKKAFEESRESSNDLLKQRLLEIRRLEENNYSLAADIETLNREQLKLTDGFNEEIRSLGMQIERLNQAVRNAEREFNSAKDKNNFLQSEISRVGEMYGGCMKENEKLLRENDEYYTKNMQLGIKLREMGQMREMAETLYVEFNDYKRENNKNLTEQKVRILEEQIIMQQNEMREAQEELDKTFRQIKVVEERGKEISAGEKKQLQNKIDDLEKIISRNELEIEQKDEKLQRCVQKHIKFLKEINEKRS